MDAVYFRSYDLENDLQLFRAFIQEAYGNIPIRYKIFGSNAVIVANEAMDFNILQILERLMSQRDENIIRNAHLIECLTQDNILVRCCLMFELYKRLTQSSDEERPTYTYIIKDTFNGLFKIGRTVNLSKRFSALSCGNPNLSLAGILDKDVEKELHQIFKKNKVSREWYRLSDKDIRRIKRDYRFIITV